MDPFFLEVVGALVGMATTLVAGLNTWYLKSRRQEALDGLAAKQLQSVLSRGTLQELRQYIERDLGGVVVSDYVRRDDIRERVDQCLAKLDAFLDESTGLEPTRISLQEISSLIQRGQAWDAMVRLRVHLESRLRDVAERAEIDVGSSHGAGQLLRVLAQHGLLERETLGVLGRALDTMNKAVHGARVEPHKASAALAAVQRWSASLDGPSVEWPPSNA